MNLQSLIFEIFWWISARKNSPVWPTVLLSTHTHTSVFILRYSPKLWSKRRGWILFQTYGHSSSLSLSFLHPKHVVSKGLFMLQCRTDTVDQNSPASTSHQTDFFLWSVHSHKKTERLLHVVTAPKCDPELLIIQYIIYWWICWLEALYNRWLCCGCRLVCAVADATEVPSSPTPVTVFQ